MLTILSMTRFSKVAVLDDILSESVSTTRQRRLTTQLSDGAPTPKHAGAPALVCALRSAARGRAVYANRRSLQRRVRRQHVREPLRRVLGLLGDRHGRLGGHTILEGAARTFAVGLAFWLSAHMTIESASRFC